MVKIDFSFEYEHGKYRDAIVLPDDHNMSDADIEVMKQQRFENWTASFVSTEEPQE